MNTLHRALPAVGALRHKPPLAQLPDAIAVLLAREAIAAVRQRLANGEWPEPQAIAAAVAAEVAARVARLQQPSLRRILNGSGVLLHTNGGRAPLPAPAIAAMVATARGYCNLEFSLDDGRRSSRQDHVAPLLCWLTGAEAALVVNNGAAALLLALHVLAAGQRVLVSRGELLEIGGGFRIPDVMIAAGAVLHEVGTTNRTHVRDYARPLAAVPGRDKRPPIAALLQVHRSNFALVGFTHTPELAALAELAHGHGKPLVVDMGSGALSPLAGLGPDALDREPDVRAILAAGADLVLFSGDKLVGGPQAGILVGARGLVSQLAEHPLARALRVDNLTLAALESVLRLHLLGRAPTDLPVLAAVETPVEAVAQWVEECAAFLRRSLAPEWSVTTEPSEAQLGGGADPLVRLPSHCLALAHSDWSGPRLQRRLLAGPVPIIARVRDDRLLLDGRTLAAGSPGESPQEVGAELLGCLATASAAQ